MSAQKMVFNMKIESIVFLLYNGDIFYTAMYTHKHQFHEHG